MKKIAITGGIGSGKSVVCHIIQSKGYPVFNSDKWAKELMVSDIPLKQAIEALLGKDAFHSPSKQPVQLNAAYIASKIFERAELKAQLEELVHPVVRLAFEDWAKNQNTVLVFQESALILATEYYKNFDAIVLVSSPEELRLQRVMKRDGIDRSAVIARMKSQPDFESLLHKVTHIIDNSDSLSLEDQVNALILDLLEASDV